MDTGIESVNQDACLIYSFCTKLSSPAGDVLLTSAYLSYVGCFGRSYRTELLEQKWIPFLKSLDVSLPALAITEQSTVIREL